MSFFGKLFGKPKDDPLKNAMQAIYRLIDDEERQNSMLPEPIAQAIKGGVSCDVVPGASGRFGFEPSNPIPVNGAIGELAYLSRLESASGERLLFHRIGAIDKVDVFEAVTYSGSAWFVFFVDMYHPRRSRQAPEGFVIAKEPRQFSGFHNHCKEFPYDFVKAKGETPDLLRLAYIPLGNVMAQIEKRMFNRPLAHKAKLDIVKSRLTSVLIHGDEESPAESRSVGPKGGPLPAAESRQVRTRPTESGTSGPMYDIPMNEVSEEFAECWRAAGRHLQQQGQKAISWLRAHLHPPMLEHLSFRLGNQLFFICLDAEGLAPFSAGNAKALHAVATGCRGHACIMPLKRTPNGWTVTAPGWGLLDMTSRRPIDPPALVSYEKIEMSDWELQDFAVQIVREQLEKEGRKIMSWQGNPDVDPSLWFGGDNGPEWVVVRAVRYPERDAIPPANWSRIAESCARMSKTGHFASVAVANAEDSFDPAKGSPMPLWRGHGMVVRYSGLSEGPGVKHQLGSTVLHNPVSAASPTDVSCSTPTASARERR